MKPKQRRDTICHNCQSELKADYNYCPVCGQSNTDNNVTFSTLISEFIDNYLGLDSKMAHSVVPFLFGPGALTNRFNEGRIKHFIHPVRLYFVMSLFYFFTISYLLSDYDLRSFDEARVYSAASLEDFKDDELLQLLPDSTKIQLLNDSLKVNLESIENFGILLDSIESRFGEDFIEDTEISLQNVSVPKEKGESSINKFHRLARDPNLSDQDFIDSLAQNNISLFTDGDFWDEEQKKHLYGQIRKIFENDEGFKGFVLGNLPLMMFILIPLFAVILKFIYVRRKHLYIKHVVHALHVHSFAYLLYGLGLLLSFNIFTETYFPNRNIDEMRGVTCVIFFLIVSTYTYISFMKVYQQGWFKSFIKFNLVGWIYGFFLLFFFMGELIISFWFY